ncbi:MAG TPA: Crp/Fnr family transcriptional regulator [Burkholderiaceae bacterium]|nr:Crp/Fnr family transcriptional regulator [Burkholderiaceae bacterium]
MVPRLLDRYPPLASMPPDLRETVLAAHAQAVDAPSGAVLFDEGTPCQGFPLVLDGEVRVARGSAQGRALELYRVSPGEVCVVSASCLFGARALQAHGVAAVATRLLLIAPPGFDRWCTHEPFRRFVFGVFAERLADLMGLVEAVAFQRLDQRLAHALLGRGSVVTITHQALADELGTVREIVTRLLRRFERAGWLRLGRERIDILDPRALREAASVT